MRFRKIEEQYQNKISPYADSNNYHHILQGENQRDILNFNVSGPKKKKKKNTIILSLSIFFFFFFPTSVQLIHLASYITHTNY